VLAGSRLPDDDLLELAEQRAVVLLNRQVASLPSVVTDSADAGRQIIAHLAALGHRSVTYLGGPAKRMVRRRALVCAGSIRRGGRHQSDQARTVRANPGRRVGGG